jgi:hypothetical protein
LAIFTIDRDAREERFDWQGAGLQMLESLASPGKVEGVASAEEDPATEE